MPRFTLYFSKVRVKHVKGSQRQMIIYKQINYTRPRGIRGDGPSWRGKQVVGVACWISREVTGLKHHRSN